LTLASRVICGRWYKYSGFRVKVRTGQDRRADDPLRGPPDPALASKSSQSCHAVHTSGFTAQQGGTERQKKTAVLAD